MGASFLVARLNETEGTEVHDNIFRRPVLEKCVISDLLSLELFPIQLPCQGRI
jgi:hypothetical protein